MPLSGGSSSTYFNIVGEPQLPMDRAPGANFRAITPGFLHTIGIPLIKGRNLTELDDGREPKAPLISQRMAQKYWKGKNPIGLQLKIAYGTEFLLAK